MPQRYLYLAQHFKNMSKSEIDVAMELSLKS